MNDAYNNLVEVNVDNNKVLLQKIQLFQASVAKISQISYKSK